MSTYSKDVRNLILDVDYDIDNVDELLENDYEEVIQGLFSALFILLEHYPKDEITIKEILDKIEEISTKETNTKKLKLIQIKTKQLINSTTKNFNIDLIVKENNILKRLDNITNLIASKIQKIQLIANEKILENIIYKEKNLLKLKNLLKTDKELFDCTDIEHDILYKVLSEYVELDKKDKYHINYLYKVIVLLFTDKKYNNKNFDISRYIDLLCNNKYKDQKHIKELTIRLLEKEKISLGNLESKYKVNITYPQKLEDELIYYSKDYNNRYDFTKQYCITIDGEDDRCLDDALYMQKNSNGTYTLYVHITDIPSIIPYNSLIYKEAMKRGENLYLYNNTSTIYPESITYNTCSLLPNVKRNTITYIITLDNNFDIINFDIVKGIILVKNKLSYNKVDKLLENNPHNQLECMLQDLGKFSLRQKKKNKVKEKYRELENLLNNKSYHQSTRTNYSISANIVQESMVLTNHLIPKHFNKLDLPYPNRVLHLMKEQEITSYVYTLLKENKITLSKQEIEKLVKKLKSFSLGAWYAVDDFGHDGIGEKYYSHSSSPGRRSMDSFGQYIIYDLIFNNNRSDINIQKWYDETEKMCKYLNQKKQDNELFANQYNYLASKKLIKTK